MEADKYYTIENTGEGKVTEKMSRFLSFAIPVSDVEEARVTIKAYQNQYHDSRHVCWAYVVGPQRDNYNCSDNGEPSGTAGKPILGQINSRELTNVLVVVVRYFGGIKLGTPGLIAAYRESASLALDSAGRKEVQRMERIEVVFPYTSMNDVMKVVKEMNLNILERSFDNVCTILLDVPLPLVAEAKGRLGLE